MRARTGTTPVFAPAQHIERRFDKIVAVLRAHLSFAPDLTRLRTEYLSKHFDRFDECQRATQRRISGIVRSSEQKHSSKLRPFQNTFTDQEVDTRNIVILALCIVVEDVPDTAPHFVGIPPLIPVNANTAAVSSKPDFIAMAVY